MTISPCDVYTVLVALVVAMVIFSAWCWDRLAESRAREGKLRTEIDELRRRLAPTQRAWISYDVGIRP